MTSHLREQWRRAAGRYSFEVDFSADKGTLAGGEVVSGTHYLEVEADTELEARLLAEQMVAATGREPTDARRMATTRVSMPSWRSLSYETPWWSDFDAVIATDANGRGRNFECFSYGQPFATRHSLAEAKAAFEEVYGPLPWRRERMPRETAVHYYWGATTEFTDPLTVYVVDALPKLGVLRG